MVMLVIGQCLKQVKGTVDTSSLSKWTGHIMCAHCCLLFHQVNFFFKKTYNRCLDSFLNFDMVLINC